MAQTKAPDILAEAVALHAQGHWEKAEELYRQVLEAEPENADALNYLGVLADEAGYPDDATNLISQAIEQDPTNAPYFINLNADDTEWPKSRKRLMDAAHFGHLAGATEIIFHPGSYFGRPPAEVLKVALPRLEGCVHELQAAGNTATLRPEIMGKAAMLGSLEDTLQMAQAMDQVQPCIDFAHLHARPGDGSMNTYDEWAGMLQAYGEALGQEGLRKLSIHISGIEYGPKGERNHLPIPESDLNLDAILQALKDFGCAGRILSESPVMEEDALRVKARWMAISGETEGA